MSTPTGDRSPTADGGLARRLLIVDPDVRRGLDMAAELRRAGLACRIDVVVPEPQSRELTDEVDVVLVHLGGPAVESLSFAVTLVGAQPWLEVVFCFDNRKASSEAHAARQLGLQRLIPCNTVAGWLARAFGALARAARARRALQTAEAEIPALPDPTPATPGPVPWPEAEQSFREAYLRGLLSQADSQKQAALRAGIPYTTLCSMVKKLALTPPRAQSRNGA